VYLLGVIVEQEEAVLGMNLGRLDWTATRSSQITLGRTCIDSERCANKYSL